MCWRSLAERIKQTNSKIDRADIEFRVSIQSTELKIVLLYLHKKKSIGE
jgi:hypothetical protein